VILNTSVQQKQSTAAVVNLTPPSQLVENLNTSVEKLNTPVETVGNLWGKLWVKIAKIRRIFIPDPFWSFAE